MTWIDLSSATVGPTPAPRAFHGFVNIHGRFFVHGGVNIDLGWRVMAVEGVRILVAQLQAYPLRIREMTLWPHPCRS